MSLANSRKSNVFSGSDADVEGMSTAKHTSCLFSRSHGLRPTTTLHDRCCIANRSGERRDLSRARGEQADGVDVWERSGLDDIEGHAVSLRTVRRHRSTYRRCRLVAPRCGAQVVRNVHADAHGLPYRRGLRRGSLGAVRGVCEEQQVVDLDGVLGRAVLRSLKMRSRCFKYSSIRLHSMGLDCHYM